MSSAGGSTDAIAKVIAIHATAPVFNLTVDKDHSYFVKSGNHWLWVHNSCDETNPTSVNQMRKQIERGQSPEEVEFAHNGHIEGQQPHIHIRGKGSINQDGTLGHIGNWEEGGYRISNETKRWITGNGWKVPTGLQ